jgi:hypothetical protein
VIHNIGTEVANDVIVSTLLCYVRYLCCEWLTIIHAS